MTMMRLDKFLSNNTAISRNDTRKLVKKGDILVNGEKVKKADIKINPEIDTVSLFGEDITYHAQVYIVMNKPDGYVCSADEKGKPIVLDLLSPDMEKRQPFSVGRLDIDTTGLVILTDDGKWNYEVTSPKKKCPKKYHVVLAEKLTEDLIPKFAEGIVMDNDPKPCKPAELTILNDYEAELILHEGRFHQVKRMFASVGNHVNKLHRESIGGFILPSDLEEGEWRHMTQEEIDSVTSM